MQAGNRGLCENIFLKRKKGRESGEEGGRKESGKERKGRKKMMSKAK